MPETDSRLQMRVIERRIYAIHEALSKIRLFLEAVKDPFVLEKFSKVERVVLKRLSASRDIGFPNMAEDPAVKEK